MGQDGRDNDRKRAERGLRGACKKRVDARVKDRELTTRIASTKAYADEVSTGVQSEQG